jgi:hypothetical protein
MRSGSSADAASFATFMRPLLPALELLVPVLLEAALPVQARAVGSVDASSVGRPADGGGSHL